MTRRRTRRTTLPCPSCGGPGSIPIVYGYPTIETMQRAQRGEVALGGCIIMPNQPHQTLCARCAEEAYEAEFARFFGDAPSGESSTDPEHEPDQDPHI